MASSRPERPTLVAAKSTSARACTGFHVAKPVKPSGEYEALPAGGLGRLDSKRGKWMGRSKRGTLLVTLPQQCSLFAFAACQLLLLDSVVAHSCQR